MTENKIPELNDYIRYRRAKSREAYENACLLAVNGAWNAAINRLYYSCFYMTTALLLRYDVRAQTHSGVKSEFARRFVKEGIIGKKYFRLYSDLMDWRQKGDYGDMFDFDGETVTELLPQVKDFLDVVECLM